jgi:tyrosine-protein phosphatase SIW14
MIRRTLPLAFLFLFPSPLLAQNHAVISVQPPAAAVEPAYGEKLRLDGIHNAGKINDVLYRGAQPKEQGLTELKKLGISTIVDLRREDPAKIAWERHQAESLGMRFVHIPVTGWSSPTDEQVAEFLALFHSNPQQKIFVHCRLGEDRTGLFVAIYRIALEKWTPEQAMKEMYFFGFNGFMHPGMKTFVRGFPTRLSSSPSLASILVPALPR